MTWRSVRTLGVLLGVCLLTLDVVGQTPPPAAAPQTSPAPSPTEPSATAVTSPNGRRTVWASEDGKSVWTATRATATAAWSTPARLLTIRGSVGKLVFSPDGNRIAFENPRNGSASVPAVARNDQSWAFIVVCDIASRRVDYVEPSFATDSDPMWSSDGKQISFTRKVGPLPEARLTKSAPSFLAWTAPPARAGETFSIASVLGLPLVAEPAASGDGRSIAYAAREGVSRNIYFLRVGTPARRIVAFAGDDGQELTQVAVSKTGAAVAFARGAATNPASVPDPPQSEIWIVGTHASASAARVVGAGTAPRFSSDDTKIMWMGAQRSVSMTATLTWTNGALAAIGTPAIVPAPPAPAAGSPPAGTASPDGKRIAVRRQGGVEIYDVASKATWVVQNSTMTDAALLWSPDSRYLAMRKTGGGARGSAGINGYRYNGDPVADQPWAISIADVNGSEVTQVFQARTGMGSASSGQMFWSDDNRIAFQWEGDGWQHYYSVPATGGEPTLMTRGDGDVEFAQLSLDRKHLIITSNIGDLGRRHISVVDFRGGTIAIIKQGAASQWAPVQLADGKLAYIEADHERPPAVMIRDRDGKTTPAGLPRVPSTFPSSALVEPMLVEFPGTDGQTAYGQLFVPSQPKGCGVIFAHGGIRRQMLPGFHYIDAYSHLYEMNQYLVSHGCVVLSVEYRSSIMRGYKFRNAPGWGYAGASEMLDIAGGAKYLMARADVDASRGIGVYGLSWGGYITAQALARYPELFSVGFDMAGVHTSTDEAGVKFSAMAFLDQWKSPMLLSQGDDDRNVAFSEGLKLARALQEKRPNVELALRVVPNETHDLYLTFEHLVTVYQEGSDFLLTKLLKR